MSLPNYTSWNYRVWHYTYLTICGLVFFFLIAPLFVILPLSFNAEQYIHFSEKMLALDPDGFSLRWYKDMIWGTKNPWGLATKNSLIIAFFATIGSTILGTVAALGLSSRHMPYKAAFMGRRGVQSVGGRGGGRGGGVRHSVQRQQGAGL